eukprot:704846-Rhodomonas_salina.1
MVCMSWSRMCASLGGGVGTMSSSLRDPSDLGSSTMSGIACTALFAHVSITFSWGVQARTCLFMKFRVCAVLYPLCLYLAWVGVFP